MSFSDTGWKIFESDRQIADWVQAVRPNAMSQINNPAHRAAWLRHGGTWFVGVNLLPNDPSGRVGQGPALGGAAKDWLDQTFGVLPLDRAQLSVNYPGYPQQDPDESDANHAFRKNRDAAHVDGLIPDPATRRRTVQEFHAYVWGIPLTHADNRASPMVIWEGSHHIILDAFKEFYADVPSCDWHKLDVTEVYQAARRKCFETCARKVIHVPVAGSYVVHRLSVHGVAPWGASATADPEGRVIAYFRPEFTDGRKGWLQS